MSTQKKMNKGNVSKERVRAVAAATDDAMIKGVCHSLLEDDNEAMQIFRSEANKRFSVIDQCLRWPAIEKHKTDLEKIRQELLKAKRGLNELRIPVDSPASGGSHNTVIPQSFDG